MKEYIIGGLIAVLVAVLVAQSSSRNIVDAQTRRQMNSIAKYSQPSITVDTQVGLISCGEASAQIITEIETIAEILRTNKRASLSKAVAGQISQQVTQITLLLRQSNLSAVDRLHLGSVLAGQEEHPNPLEWNTMSRKFMSSEENDEDDIDGSGAYDGHQASTAPLQGYQKNPTGVLAALLDMLAKQMRAGQCTSGYFNLRTLWFVAREIAGRRPAWLVDREQQAKGIAQWDYIHDHSGDEFTRALERSYTLASSSYFNDPAPLIEPFKASKYLPRDSIYRGAKTPAGDSVDRGNSTTAQLAGQIFHFDNSQGTQKRDGFNGRLPNFGRILSSNQVEHDWQFNNLAKERNAVAETIDRQASNFATTAVLNGRDDMRGIEMVAPPKHMLDNSFEGSVERDIISQRSPGYFAGYMRGDDNYTTWRGACMGNCPDDAELWNECVAYDVSLQGALRGQNDSLFCPSTMSWAEWASDSAGRGVS